MKIFNVIDQLEALQRLVAEQTLKLKLFPMIH